MSFECVPWKARVEGFTGTTLTLEAEVRQSMQELPRRLSHPCEAYPYGSFHCSLTRLVYVATTRSSTAACGHAYELVAYVAQLAVFHFSQRSQNSAVSELYTQKFPSWAVEGSGKWVDVEEVVSPVASSRSSLKSNWSRSAPGIGTGAGTATRSVVSTIMNMICNTVLIVPVVLQYRIQSYRIRRV